MAYGSKAFRKASGLIVLLGMALQATEVAVQRDKLRGKAAGTLVVDEQGVAYNEQGKGARKHSWRLAWPDVQQALIVGSEVRVLTYEDVRWKLGRDREYRLSAVQKDSLAAVAGEFEARLGPRFVAGFTGEVRDAEWQVPVKLRQIWGGSEGVLSVGECEVTYASRDRKHSRTWKLSDIDNVTSSGPYELTITTFERAPRQYMERKAFAFQLKAPLDERVYQVLWRRLNESKQLQVLREIKEKQ